MCLTFFRSEDYFQKILIGIYIYIYIYIYINLLYSVKCGLGEDVAHQNVTHHFAVARMLLLPKYRITMIDILQFRLLRQFYPNSKTFNSLLPSSNSPRGPNWGPRVFAEEAVVAMRRNLNPVITASEHLKHAPANHSAHATPTVLWTGRTKCHLEGRGSRASPRGVHAL